MSGEKKNDAPDLMFNEDFGNEPEPTPPPQPVGASSTPPSQSTTVDIPAAEPEETVPAVPSGKKKEKKKEEVEEEVPLVFTESTAVPAVTGTIQETDAPPHGAPEADEEGQNEQQKGRFDWLSLKPFTPYFNVDTKEVQERILNSLKGPFRPDFVEMVKEKPDLYGPFWIATTLIFWTVFHWNTMVSRDNKDTDSQGQTIKTEEWDGDYSKFISAALLFYIYVFLLGLLVYFILRMYQSNTMSIVDVWCVYGYALSPLLPAVLLMCVCQAIKKDRAANGLTILIAGIGTLYSGSFLLINFRKALEGLGNRSLWVVLFMGACHVFLGLFLAIYFH